MIKANDKLRDLETESSNNMFGICQLPSEDTRTSCSFSIHPPHFSLSSVLPEVTVGVDDPHSKGLDPGLLSGHPLMTAKHAQRKLVDPRLKHRNKLSL